MRDACVRHTLPLAPFRWAKDVPSDGAPVSPRNSLWTALDFLLRRAALPLASCDVEKCSFAVPRRGNGSGPDPGAAMMGDGDGEQSEVVVRTTGVGWLGVGSRTMRQPGTSLWFVIEEKR